MGVHGLTFYLRDNQRKLSQTINLPGSANDKITIVVDGWSFIYALYHKSNLPWAFGGEYEQLGQLVQTVIQAWIKVGLTVYVVFDGPYPSLKFATGQARVTQSVIKPSLLFFRTSAAARAAPGFLHESRIIPPLVYTATVQALNDVKKTVTNLQVFFADEEGDPFAVELAGRVGGYVVGNDSDFVVLNAEGYRGYIPLEDMVWCAATVEEDASIEESGFQPAKRSKAKRPNARFGRGLLPPSADPNATLSLTVYSPTSLASHLDIPVSLLPLLGALVGNDYSIQSHSMQRSPQYLFFSRQLTPSQRIERVASTIHSVVYAPSNKRKPKQQIGSVMDLIGRTVHALLDSASTLSSGEVETIINGVVDSTLQYAIPKSDAQDANPETLWPTPVCPLHQADACPLLPLISRNVAERVLQRQEEDLEDKALETLDQVRSLYLSAYRAGKLSPRIMDVLHTSTYWPRHFLEHPDFETVGRSIGRPVREWAYAVLDDAVGLEPPRPEPVAEPTDEPVPEADEDSDDSSDELIDVVEEDSDDDDEGFLASDPLAPLKGALQQLHNPDSDESPEGTSASPQPGLPAKVIVEHLRRGTRLVEEQVVVPSLNNLVAFDDLDAQFDAPLLLQPEDRRLDVLLRALESDLPIIRQLPSTHVLPVLAVRWVILTIHRRSEETGSVERRNERWTQHEVRCLLAGLFSKQEVPENEDPPAVTDRNIQLVAQVLMAVESIHHFCQILLLTERLPASSVMLSGRAIHAYLMGARTIVDKDLSSELWQACVHGLEHTMAEDRRLKSKRKAKTSQAKPPLTAKQPSRGASRGVFALLSDAEA
ncbi:hypothetical protein HGRIS_002162 [Hohenbuehelia grisea]|uniref:Asteroid domain-containing protein n=1 Tax=Hohenbuehelia grisea TaxID=104357 RepID=A0ABR3JJP5_9AGAR